MSVKHYCDICDRAPAKSTDRRVVDYACRRFYVTLEYHDHNVAPIDVCWECAVKLTRGAAEDMVERIGA